MRKVITFLIVCLIVNEGFSQNPLGNIAFQETSDVSPILMTAINNNYYFAASPSYIYSVNKAGNLRFRLALNIAVGYFMDLIPTYNGIAFIYHGNSSCDVASDSLYLMKIDTLGGIIFTKSLPINYSSPLLLVEYSDSSLYAFANDTLFHLSENGIVFRKQYLGFGPVASVCSLQNGHFLFSTNNNGNMLLVETDTNAVAIKQQNAPCTFSKLSPAYGLSSNNFIAKIDTNLQVTATTQTTQGSAVVNDFSFLQDTLYTCGNDGSQHLVFTKFDTLLQQQYQFTSIFPRILPIKISTANQQIAFLSSESPNTANANTYLSFTAINGYNAFSYPNDVGVTQIALDSNYISYTVPAGAPATIHEMDLYYKLKITVKNYGRDTLHTVYINHVPNINAGLGLYCQTYYYNKYYTGLQLLPNDSIVLTTDLINAFAGYIYTPIPQDTTLSFSDFCAWTSAPNNKSDNNHNNDLSCNSVVFHATGIEQLLANNEQLAVYPNPSNGLLNLSISQFDNLKMHSIEVYNTIGDCVHRQMVTSANCQINLSSLPSGIYNLSIINNEGVVNKRVVISHP